MAGAIGPAPENASEAVDTETPAAEATSASVGRDEDRAASSGCGGSGLRRVFDRCVTGIAAGGARIDSVSTQRQAYPQNVASVHQIDSTAVRP